MIRGTAAAASGVLTVMRTISDPARHSSAIWRAVDSTSVVSVLVIDWTTTGAPPPTVTPPTSTVRVERRGSGPKGRGVQAGKVARFIRHILPGPAVPA